MCPANAPKPQPEATTADLDPRLSLERFPKLHALVQGPDGPEILLELQKLVHREPSRATRYERDLFARIHVAPEEPPEIAVIRDLSRSGARLELSASARLDVMRARTVSIEMRLPGTPFVTREATLVRVVERRDNGVELAFSFIDSAGHDPAFDTLLGRLASARGSAR